jgi:ketosteroid isomerase-like protein
LVHLHPDAVVVWQNAEISRGHDGVRKYYDKNLGGPDAVLESYTVEPTVSERTALYGDDMGIAYGTIRCHFKFKDGRQFDLTGPWSATLVRNNGTWQIVSFHASVGLFDNPLLLRMTTWLLWGCIAAFAGGLAIGTVLMAVLMAVIKRRKRV